MKRKTGKPARQGGARWERRLRWTWLYPGVRLKRWIILLILSAIVIGVGVSGMMGDVFRNFEVRVIDYRPLARQIQSLRFIDFLLLVLGVTGAVLAFRRSLYSILTVLMPTREKEYASVALKRLRLKRGPKLVAIGGGTGLPALLSGLKEFSSNITAVVTMADDGGSSGRLRREYKTPPPGDLRNCLVALAETSPLMSQLFQHRFKGKGSGIEGHSFGNLFITALGEVTGDFATGVRAASQVLAVSGQVLPVTLDLVGLEAQLADGRIVHGESNIGKSHHPIEQLRLVPDNAKPNPDVLAAIAQADAVIMGPGSLYTSILPNLLVPGLADAVAESRAVKIFVCNVMTQPGETDKMSAVDHIRTVRDHTRRDIIQFALANTEMPSQDVLRRYGESKAEPVMAGAMDVTQLDEMGVTLIRSRLAKGKDVFRHDPGRLARVILKLIVI